MGRGSQMQAWSQEPNGRLVVKNTFVEVLDSPDCSCERGGLRPRANSDSAIFESGEQEKRRLVEYSPESLEGETAKVDFELTGLDDTDSDTNDEKAVPLPCYSHIDEFVEPSLTDSEPQSQHSSKQPGALDRPQVEEPGSSGVPSEAASQLELDRLVSENARLAFENQLLRKHLVEAASAEAAAAPEWTGESSGSPEVKEATPQCVNGWWVPMGFGPVHSQVALCAVNAAESPLLHGRCNPQAASAGAMAPLPSRRQRGHKVSTSGARTSAHATTAAAAALAPGHGGSGPCEASMEQRTTVMLRNLPNNYSRAMLLAMLDDEGFGGQYDFLYLPIDFKSRACLGYAFINLVDDLTVSRFWATFDGFSNWVLPSKKVCGVSWSGPHQGLESHVERYRNSPVMHTTVPDEYKPVVFKDGVRVVFPPPTKTPRAPRVRNHMDSKANWSALPDDPAATAARRGMTPLRS